MAVRLTNNTSVQGSFIMFPGYSNQFPSTADFDKQTDSFINCVLLCLVNVSCNVVFYDEFAKRCAGTSDIDMMTFLGSLAAKNRIQGFRPFSACDKSGYALNWKTGQCLKVVKERQTWDDARQYCMDDGGVLAKLDTEEKMAGATHISRIYLSYFGEFHVGASDIAVEGLWKWMDGTNVSGIQTHFNNLDMAYNPPDPANCGGVSTALQILFYSRCDRKNYFICERIELELL